MATASTFYDSRIIEKIVDRRENNGITEYCLKLKGSDETIWEVRENLDCDELIKAYDKGNKSSLRKQGFNRGLSPEKILGATNAHGFLEFLIKWKFCDEVDLVPSKEASEKCPQIVIKFYEERLSFAPE